MKPFTVMYRGIAHTCTDPACHVVGFVNTLTERDTVLAKDTPIHDSIETPPRLMLVEVHKGEE